MQNQDLWKYCTFEHCRELLLSFQLFGQTNWSDQKQITCLYTLNKHINSHYSQITIPKRNGSARHILAPSPLLKKVQRNILHHILDQIPVSRHATAYSKGSTIVANAAKHTGQKQILKLDIEDFFRSIRFLMVYNHAFSKAYFPPAIQALLTNLCCYKGYLPQGAPTSAAISNLVMKPFDEYIEQWCCEREITYTRYCDDMVFSGDFEAKIVKNKVQNFLQTMGLNLNHTKTKRLRQHQQQTVTGIVVNDKTQTPSLYRKALRQEIYYIQKFGIDSHLKKIDDQLYLPLGQVGREHYLSALLGKINFILHANPNDFFFQAVKLYIKQEQYKLKIK